MMCKVLDVSKSGYYKWRQAGSCENERAQYREKIRRLIRKSFYLSDGTYGSPRVHDDLVDWGYVISQKTVARMMKEMGLRATPEVNYRTTTDSNHDQKIYPNLLNRKFHQDAPNKVWITDMTYIWTLEGWVYLASVIDLFSRKVIGWHMATTMKTKLPLQALKMAINKRQTEEGLIHHSDRGSQYCSGDYTDLLKEHKMQISMSNKGDPYDNACMESFHATLKKELVYRRRFKSRAEAIHSINRYISRYNEWRKHSSLGYCSPNQFEYLYHFEQAEKIS